MSSYDPFAEDYDAWTAEMTDDVGWYVELARQAKEPIVELAIGTGRVATAVARETGKRVIGIDSSPAMLAVARERMAGLPVELYEGDMRDFAVEKPVDLVICPARSLLHLPTWLDRRLVFERVATALRPGGRFAWNAFVFSATIAARVDGKRDQRTDGLWEEVRYVHADSRIELTRGRGESTLGTICPWWVTKSEWEGLLDVAGLEAEALYGGFNREPFDDDSLEFVWVARKP
jgi:ubiquinone/menaquinone biosynthesis C-methylase UbiE